MTHEVHADNGPARRRDPVHRSLHGAAEVRRLERLLGTPTTRQVARKLVHGIGRVLRIGSWRFLPPDRPQPPADQIERRAHGRSIYVRRRRRLDLLTFRAGPPEPEPN